MKRITQTNEIQTGDNSGVVFSGNEKASYSDSYPIESFQDNDLITKQAAEALISSNNPPVSIMPWLPDSPTDSDQYRSYVIGDIEYLFRSNEDGNTSEPSLSSGGGDAWDNLGPTQDGFSPDVWSNSTTYAIGDFSRIIASSKNVFKSKVNGNLNNQPLFNTTDAFWECLGDYKGLFPNDAPYAVDEIAFDTATQSVYRSNINDNNYPLDAEISGSWALVGIKSLDYTAENVANKATDFTTVNNTLYPSVQAVKNETDLKIPLTQKAASNGVATLDSGGKVPASQLPNSIMDLQGDWNASTNTPTLSNGTGNPGDVWLVTVAGTQNLGSGNITFNVNDFAIYGASGVWFKSSNSNEVTTVFGRKGTVVAVESDYSSFYPLLDGTGSSGNWPISVTGNAATASNSTQWNSLTYYGSGLATTPLYAMVYDGAHSRQSPADETQFRTWLGIPSGGETLQSVWNRGPKINAATNVNLVIGVGANPAAMALSAVNDASNANTPLELRGSYINLAPGNVGVDYSTDQGYKLAVNGTGKFAGQLNIPSENDILFGTTGGSSPGIGQYFNAASNNLKFYNAIGGADLLTLNRSTGNATFSGTVTGAKGIFTASSGGDVELRNANPYIAWWDASGTTRKGYIQHSATILTIVNDEGGGVAINNPLTVIGNVTAPNFTGGLLESNANSGGTTSFKYVEDDGAWKLTSTFPGDATFDVAGSILATSATIGSTTIGTSTSNIQGTSTATYIRPTSGTGGGFVIFQNPSGTTDWGSVGVNGWIGGATLTGTPTAPTATAGTNTTQIATTAFVQGAVSLQVSGRYTPSFTSISGVSAFVLLGDAFYQRIGDIVSVKGRVRITVSSASPSFLITLPIASAFTVSTDAAGGIVGYGSSVSGVTQADAATDSVTTSATTPASGDVDVTYDFMYTIK